MTAQQPKLPAPGDTLAGKYRIEGVVGEGGMAVVYEATHLRMGQRVAIKMLHPHVLAKPELATRFAREARAAGQLRSPNTARVFDVDATPDGTPYLVMEFLEGHDLSVELEKHGALSIATAVECVLQAARAMAEAHAQGVVHRDLKPSNLFLARQGEELVVKVLDFGISKIDPRGEIDVSVTSTLAVMGTPLYMSPEQVRSAKNVDARTDVWSLGIILYELLAANPPFVGTATAVSAAIVADVAPSLRAARPDVPDALDAVIAKAMAKSPADRWQSMNEMAAALAPFGSASQGASSMRMGSTSTTAANVPASRNPSLAIGPTLAQTPPTRSGVQPLVAPTLTDGSWSTQGGASSGAKRGRIALIVGLAAVVVVGGAVAAATLRGRDTPGTPASAASPVNADVPSSTSPNGTTGDSVVTLEPLQPDSLDASASAPAPSVPVRHRTGQPPSPPAPRTGSTPAPGPPSTPQTNPIHI